MGQKTHPLGFRIGISKEHQVDWFQKPNGQYANYLNEDLYIRNLLLKENSICGIFIRRKSSQLHIFVKTNRLSLLQKNVQVLHRKIQNRLDFQVDIHLEAVKEYTAQVLAHFMVSQLERRVAFRRVLKETLRKVQNQKGGIKLQVAGRLNGAEIARTEWIKEGQVPLQTLSANIDYAQQEAHTIYGVLGIKVWLFKPSKTK